MKKYTAYGKKVDLEVQKQLDKICKIIVKYTNPISIILIGGFGRGEGSIIYKKGKFIPINDYDIYAITSKNFPNEIMEKICIEASESIGKKCINFNDFSEDMEYSIEKTFYPDIRVINISEIKKLPPFLKYFEIKYGATTIYGEDIIKDIPKFNIRDVPRSEGFRFLMNRLSLMIMHFPYSVFSGLTESDKERLINFNMKTALSSAEALLLYSKKFVASYEKRSEILKKTYKKDFKDLYKKIPNLPEIVERYTEQKLRPNYNQIKDPIDDWFILRDYAGEIIKFLLLKFTGKEAKSVKDVSKTINKVFFRFYIKDYLRVKYNITNDFILSLLKYPADFVLNLLFIKKIFDSKNKFYFGPLKHPFIPIDLKVFAAAFLIISSLERDGNINKELFEKATKYLKQIYPIDSKFYKDLNWEKMREAYGTIFNMYGFQKLI